MMSLAHSLHIRLGRLNRCHIPLSLRLFPLNSLARIDAAPSGSSEVVAELFVMIFHVRVVALWDKEIPIVQNLGYFENFFDKAVIDILDVYVDFGDALGDVDEFHQKIVDFFKHTAHIIYDGQHFL